MLCAEALNLGEKVVHAAHHRLDLTYLQARIQPPFAKRSVSSNSEDVAETVDIETIRETLRRIMDRKGVKPTTLSLKVGTNRTLVKDLLEKAKDVQIGTLTKLAGALDVELADLLEAPRVTVAGYIGAGGEVIFEDFGSDETVIRPPGVSGTLVALVVRGSSMLPKYKDGDIIYIQRQHEGWLPDYIGEDCAVRLKSGETFIKQLMQGSAEGKFTLLSLNAAQIVDVEIEWATPVLFIMPARSRNLLS